MRLLRMSVEGAELFGDDRLTLDLFATDRVPRLDASMPVADVTRVGVRGSVFSQNVIGITGVNASGKTTVLNLVRLVLDLLAGDVSMRGFAGQNLLIGKVASTIRVSATFWHDGFYLVESTLTKKSASFRTGRLMTGGFAFEDETIWMLQTTRVNRKMMSCPQTFKEHAVVVKRRLGGKDDEHALTSQELSLLGDARSIVSMITGRARAGVMIPQRQLPLQTLPTPVVQAFDPSVEWLEWDAENEVYLLKFKGESVRVVDRNVARILLSRGTIYGAELVNQAIEVLSCAGYLLIDEIEEAINRSLVATVIELFASPITNPHGAQLVFTTHYPELLDVLHRKDDVYLLVRGEDHRTDAIKYSDRVDRIENKKSEVLLSDLIRGTMPSYPDVRAMREYVRGHVDGSR